MEISDKDRIDWIEKHGQLNIERCKYIDGPEVYEVTPFNEDSFDGKTLRDAIDTAMRAMPNVQ